MSQTGGETSERLVLSRPPPNTKHITSRLGRPIKPLLQRTETRCVPSSTFKDAAGPPLTALQNLFQSPSRLHLLRGLRQHSELGKTSYHLPGVCFCVADKNQENLKKNLSLFTRPDRMNYNDSYTVNKQTSVVHLECFISFISCGNWEQIQAMSLQFIPRSLHRWDV